MRSTVHILPVAGMLLLAWPLASGNSAAPALGFATNPVGVSSVALSSAGVTAWLPLGPQAGGDNRMQVPNSTLPNTNPTCSADGLGGPTRCSAGPGLPTNSCSAHCDSQQTCSALGQPNGGNTECSTNGANARCSVLQPPVAPPGSSFCSAFNIGVAGSHECSVMNQGSKSTCTAQNPANAFTNNCSASNANNFVQCSVLRGGSTSSNFCSVGFAETPGAPKRCSTFAFQATCSVVMGQKGICTAFKGAPSGACSVFAGASFCSTIGGAAGSFCRG